MKLSETQKWILDLLEEKDFTSPSVIGNQYGYYKHGKMFYTKSGYHSAWASPRCKKLVDMGLLERNEKGHYRLKADNA